MSNTKHKSLKLRFLSPVEDIIALLPELLAFDFLLFLHNTMPTLKKGAFMT